eukprot:958709-Rhodomonas_salina.1
MKGTLGLTRARHPAPPCALPASVSPPSPSSLTRHSSTLLRLPILAVQSAALGGVLEIPAALLPPLGSPYY